jgi:hypothetical protein
MISSDELLDSISKTSIPALDRLLATFDTVVNRQLYRIELFQMVILESAEEQWYYCKLWIAEPVDQHRSALMLGANLVNVPKNNPKDALDDLLEFAKHHWPSEDD